MSLPLPSNAALFVANLRLLDLHLRSDWPSITPQTFSTKDANQNQKQRIRCVEWALYRLFELWDPNETRDKLQPFFPPLEPLQSLNLRAALYRSLNELKKNGVLGRDTTLRKTMLDDCKGEKFMEIIAVFSTVVVKRTVPLPRRSRQPPIGLKAALSSNPTAAQQRSLLPLAVAHKASLAELLRKRDTLKDNYALFADALDAKSQQLSVREENKDALPSSTLETKSLGALQNELNDSWVGNAAWVDVLLHGEDDAGDQVLSQDFRAVLGAVSNGRPLESALPARGLLAELEWRVQLQRERIGHWYAFHESLKKNESPSPAMRTAEPENADIWGPSPLSRHKEVKINSEATYQSQPLYSPGDRPQNSNILYSNVLSSMRERLDGVSASRTAEKHDLTGPEDGKELWKGKINTQPHIRRRLGPEDTRSGGVVPLKSEMPDNNSGLSTGKADGQLRATTLPDSPRKLMIGSPSTDPSSTDAAAVKGVSYPDNECAQASSTLQQDSPSSGFVRPPSIATDLRRSADADEATNEEAEAQRIVSSVTNATPLTAKRPIMSLAERTRLSMAHGMHQSEAVALVSANEQSPPSPKHEDSHRASLLERTRQSMSRLPANKPPGHSNRQSMHGNAEKRRSLYPVNQFETPKRQPSYTTADHSEERAEGSSTPQESLFSDDAAYASVFKSRPKVAMSPVSSPRESTTLHSMNKIMDFESSTSSSSPLDRLGVRATDRRW